MSTSANFKFLNSMKNVTEYETEQADIPEDFYIFIDSDQCLSMLGKELDSSETNDEKTKSSKNSKSGKSSNSRGGKKMKEETKTTKSSKSMKMKSKTEKSAAKPTAKSRKEIPSQSDTQEPSAVSYP